MKYYLKWITENRIEPQPLKPGESILDAFMTALPKVAYDVVYYKKTTSQIPQWIDCMSRATPFDSLESTEKMLNKLENNNYDGFFGIECSIEDDLDDLSEL